MNETEELRKKVSVLEEENQFLKSLLDQAGISYIRTALPNPLSGTEKCEQDQGARIIPEKITRLHAHRFFSYFWGRMDVFSKRYQNKNTGKAGYFPQCMNFWKDGICPKVSGNKVKCKDCSFRVWTKLEASHIESHLLGKREDAGDVVGIYPLFPDGTCRFLVFDFDNHAKDAEENDFANQDDSWKEEVDALREICSQNGIPHLTERSRSGRGAHVWIFFDGPVNAASARRFGFSLLEKGAESVSMKSFRFYDRMLPAQDNLENGELGNLIALPLQGMSLRSGNSAFIDDDWNAYPDQWKILLSTKRLSEEQMEHFTAEWTKTQKDRDSETEMPSEEDAKPWEKTGPFRKEDVSGDLQIVLSDRIYIQTANLKPRIQNRIRRLAAFPNPKFFKNHAIGLSNYAESRYLYLGEDSDGFICIPRGLLDQLNTKCSLGDISIHIEDKRSTGNPISVEFSGKLRENQEKAISQLLRYDCGILSAATAFGKTAVCCGIIAERKTSTLILLESSALIEQWEKALYTFLRISEDLPEYRTKTGKIKTRKTPVGIIHGAKDTSGGIIDIAMAGSLCKQGEFHPRLKEYGLILVDECHHSASETLSNVLREVSAKYVYGVTATPFREDGLEKINSMLLGPVRFQYSAKEKAEEQGFPHYIIPRFTRTVSPHGRDKMHVNQAYELIRDSAVRNEQIAEDIRSCILKGRTPVVLTRYTEHAALLYELVKSDADRVFLLTGNRTKKEQKTIREEMEKTDSKESLILIATGQLIGEGFNLPRLDTLIMATPVAWKGIVEQYAGRLNRDYDGKKDVMIYDYVDSHIPVFDSMYAKRMRAYKKIGYELYTGSIQEKQEADSIYDPYTYGSVYEKDLEEADQEIVISSPTLGSSRVFRTKDLLRKRQEAGVKVTVVTWHPDSYQYGEDEHRRELLEVLQNAGVHIELAKERCEHYAVIDNSIVWYGSINLLSRENEQDNIMRVVSKEIAAELLEMTFHKGNLPEESLIQIG